MSNDALLYEKRDAVAWLILNRPQAMNAINTEMIDLYERYLPMIAADDSVRVLVITGKGSAFCAGVDLKGLLGGMNVPAGEQDFLQRLCENVFDILRDFPKPVIAALNGLTIAGGLETAMCADFVIAADSAKIGDAHANFGLFPGAGGAALLPRLVPLNVAKYLLFTGKNISAKEMHTYGFINEVFAPEELLDGAQVLAELIARHSPLTSRRMKSVANAALDKSRDDALAHEQVEFRKHLRSRDFQEGLKAFAEKRTPLFEGR
jgi:enoyl-CoA hydratase/carnithine racemase